MFTDFDRKLSTDLYAKMQRLSNPPNLSDFAKVFISEYERLTQQISTEEVKICLLETNLARLEELLDSVWRSGPEIRKQLIFRASEISYIEGGRPCFKIVPEGAREVLIDLEDFNKGDLFIDILSHTEKVKVSVYSDIFKPSLFGFDIELSDLTDNKRIHKSFENAKFQLHYEIQIIDNFLDYYVDIQEITRQRLEHHLRSKDSTRDALSKLEDLFPSLRFNELICSKHKISNMTVSTGFGSHRSLDHDPLSSSFEQHDQTLADYVLMLTSVDTESQKTHQKMKTSVFEKRNSLF